MAPGLTYLGCSTCESDFINLRTNDVTPAEAGVTNIIPTPTIAASHIRFI